MKSDREFLDGVYEKARQMETKPEKNSVRKPGRRYLAVAAALLAIIIPLTAGLLMQSPEQEPGGLSLARMAQMPSPDLTWLGENAGLVVKGRVLAVKEGGFDATLQCEVTYVQLAVEEVWKGEAEGELRVRITGSTQGQTPLEAAFAEGEEVALFLWDESGEYSLCGSTQGKFTLMEADTYLGCDGEAYTAGELKNKLS